MSFELHPRLAADTLHVGDMMISRVLLMKDSRFPWMMLVPRRPDIREIIDLPVTERAVLMEEIASVSEAMQSLTHCDKLNVGALGNSVPQLHVHVVARFAGDAAWPGPVWGSGQAIAYAEGAAEIFARDAAHRLGLA